MHSQSALYFSFVGSIAEPKIDDQKPLYGSCSKTNCQWCDLQLFLFCSQPQICFFLQVRWPVFASLLHPVLLKIGFLDTLSCKVSKKCTTLAHAHQFHFTLGSVHSGSVSWDEWLSVPWWVACELVSLISFHSMPGQHSQPTDIFVSSVIRCNLLLHFWQNDWGLLRAAAVT